MKYYNFGYFGGDLGDFRDNTCSFDVESNFILFFLMNKTAKRTYHIFIKENIMKIMCQDAVTKRVIGYKHSVSGHDYKG